MRTTVFGAAGKIGSRVVAEALRRGHRVTAVVRDPDSLPGPPGRAIVRVGDASDPRSVFELTTGQDLAIGATRPAVGREHDLVGVTGSLLSGLSGTDVRLMIVGGAGSLRLPAGGGRLVDSPGFPRDLRDLALAGADQLDLCVRSVGVDWTYLSPAAVTEPGGRTGHYRLGRDELVVDDAGDSRISMEDLAVVLLDEAENPRHRKMRFTAAY